MPAPEAYLNPDISQQGTQPREMRLQPFDLVEWFGGDPDLAEKARDNVELYMRILNLQQNLEEAKAKVGFMNVKGRKVLVIGKSLELDQQSRELITGLDDFIQEAGFDKNVGNCHGVSSAAASQFKGERLESINVTRRPISPNYTHHASHSVFSKVTDSGKRISIDLQAGPQVLSWHLWEDKDYVSEEAIADYMIVLEEDTGTSMAGSIYGLNWEKFSADHPAGGLA